MRPGRKLDALKKGVSTCVGCYTWLLHRHRWAGSGGSAARGPSLSCRRPRFAQRVSTLPRRCVNSRLHGCATGQRRWSAKADCAAARVLGPCCRGPIPPLEELATEYLDKHGNSLDLDKSDVVTALIAARLLQRERRQAQMQAGREG